VSCQLRTNILVPAWEKLAWNAGFNAVTTITRSTVAEVLAVPVTRELVVRAMEEVDAVATALRDVDGAYGIAVVSSRDPDKIVVARNGSPLLLGIGKDGEYLVAFDVQDDGTLRNKRNFAKYEGVLRTPQRVTSGGDGLAIDSEGRIYACTRIGIQVFSPQGQHLGTIPLSRPPQNMAFAGSDKKTLYVVGRGAAYKIQMSSQGFLGRAK